MAATPSLPAEMTIYMAAAVRSTFQEWLRKSARSRRAKGSVDKPLIVDASAVVEIDTAGLQLLIAFSHSAAASKRRLELSQPSEALRKACVTFGLHALLCGAEDAP